jgi:Tfp pilus assembly protein PilO
MKNELAIKITPKRLKDYSYAIFFFLVFSFFVFFAIRPNIATAFTLKKELVELDKLNENYEQAIVHIINVQTVLEKYRDDYHLLSDALPTTPQVNKVVDDMYRAASASGITLKRLDIDEVNLRELEEKKLRQFKVLLQTESDFETLKLFFDGLYAQRRLKTIDNLVIKRDRTSSTSATLNLEFDINGYYL